MFSTICDAIKQSESELEFLKKKSSFQMQYMPHFQRYSLVITPSRLDLRFQKYHHFISTQNSQIQRKLNAIIYCILKSIASSDSFCLITSHMRTIPLPYSTRVVMSPHIVLVAIDYTCDSYCVHTCVVAHWLSLFQLA